MGFDIEKCSFEELSRIRALLISGELQSEVEAEYARRLKNNDYLLQSKYRSNRLPDFDSRYLEKCNKLVFDFDVMRLGLLWSEACFDKGNNSDENFYTGMFGDDKNEFGLRVRHNLAYLSMLFQDERMRRKYEGAYNAINFIINGIYRYAGKNLGQIDSVDDLFKDFALKREIVSDNFGNIIEYLRDESVQVKDSRLFVGNYVLTRKSPKSIKKVKAYGLIEAVAFGSSVGELQHGNYKGAKRLIYVPENKIR